MKKSGEYKFQYATEHVLIQKCTMISELFMFLCKETPRLFNMYLFVVLKIGCLLLFIRGPWLLLHLSKNYVWNLQVVDHSGPQQETNGTLKRAYLEII